MSDGGRPAKPPHQRAVDIERFNALNLQSPQHPGDAFRIAQKYILNQVEHVVAGAVHHRAQHRVAVYIRTLCKQRQFINFLPRRKQVSLDPLGNQRRPFPGDAFILPAATRHDPGRQLCRFHRPDLEPAAAPVQRLEPFCLLGFPVDAVRGQQQQVFRRVTACVVGQGRAAFPSGFLAAQSQFDNALAGKQGQVRAGFIQPAPVKPGIHIQDNAFVITKRACPGADLVARLL